MRAARVLGPVLGLCAGIFLMPGISSAQGTQDTSSKTVLCADKTPSPTKDAAGCARHGGVAPSEKSKTREPATDSTAHRPRQALTRVIRVSICADSARDTVSGRGACAKHGGVVRTTTITTSEGTPSIPPNY